MTRRLPLVMAAGALSLTGCATFTDNGVAARVGDVELAEDELADLLRLQLGSDDVDVASTEVTTLLLNNFVLDQLLRADLEAGGAPLAVASDASSPDGLIASVNAAITAWQAVPPSDPSPDRLRSLYDEGLTVSNIACASHILVASEPIADEVLVRLDDGDEFATLAAEYSSDGSASQGGVLPCDTTPNLAQRLVPEFVEAVLEADIGEPVGPVETQFGFHVILVRPFDDLSAAEVDAILQVPTVRLQFAADALDIYVNPRYGQFDPTLGVIPLG